MRDQMDLFVRKFLGRVKLVKSNESSRVGGSVDGNRTCHLAPHTVEHIVTRYADE